MHLSVGIQCTLFGVFCVLVFLTVDGTVLIRRLCLFLNWSGNSAPFIETESSLYYLLECDDVVSLVPTYQSICG
jgi:hypothetical protein